MKTAGVRASAGTPRISASTVERRSERRYSAVWTRASSSRRIGSRPQEIGRLPQAAGDQGIVDSPVFQAIEGMQAFEPEDRDVVFRMVDDRDHVARRSFQSGWPRSRRVATRRVIAS